MEINITGRHQMEITPALRTITQEKFNRLDKHFDHIMGIDVTFAVEKLNQIAEATVLIANGKLHATSISETTLYEAIDFLVDKLVRQLDDRRKKTLIRRKKPFDA